jgi:hypothetical protein
VWQVVDVQEGHAKVRYDGAKKSQDEWVPLNEKRIFEEEAAYEDEGESHPTVHCATQYYELCHPVLYSVPRHCTEVAWCPWLLERHHDSMLSDDDDDQPRDEWRLNQLVLVWYEEEEADTCGSYWPAKVRRVDPALVVVVVLCVVVVICMLVVLCVIVVVLSCSALHCHDALRRYDALCCCPGALW